LNAGEEVSLLPKDRKDSAVLPTKKREGERDWYDVVAAYAGLVAKISAVAFVLALGYIIYGVYGGHLNGTVEPRIVRNIEWMGKLLMAAGIVGTISLALATLDEVAYSVAVLILGVGLIFGPPALIISKLDQATSPVGVAIATWTKNTGFAICGIVTIRVIYYIVETIRSGPKARTKAQEEEDNLFGPKKVKRTQGLWSRCWQLPYCHDTIREVCPAYKERKNCWKFGRGCNCDPMLVETMIRSGAARVGKGQDKVSAQKQTTADAYLREALGAAKPATGPGAATSRAVDCKKCPIYGEHQRQKFNIVNPIAIALTIALLVVAYPIVNNLYHATIEKMAGAAAQLTLTKDEGPSGQTTTDAQGGQTLETEQPQSALDRWIGYLDTVTVKVFFFGILSLFLLSYVLKLVEWAVFVKKL
jgi:hypothetical protein